MIWPWGRRRRAALDEAARQREADAVRQVHEAESRLQIAQQLAAAHNRATARVRHELAVNGFTERMQEAMQRRGA